MSEVKYPIGVQTFETFIEEGFPYIDKTRFMINLVKTHGYFFLSRPRRFGKSLLLSTLHAYFEGRRKLFKGLAIERAELDWTPRPVLHIDLNSENFLAPDGLDNLLDGQLRRLERIYGRDYQDTTPSQRFAALIENAYRQTGQKVAILVDEYDKPLLGVEEHRDIFEHNQALLKGFFGNLKSMDRFIRFALLTGVARFNRVSIFSDINNLHDISLTEEFSDICGWTEDELVDKFRPGIEQLSTKLKKSFNETLSILRQYYDGYLFAEEGSRLYNPYSVMVALRDKNIKPHWYGTGTPTFLARRLRNTHIPLADMENQYRTYDQLLEVGLKAENPLGLMFQTGYLTIDRYDSDRQRYYLRFPNKEVQIGFARELYPYYIHGGAQDNSPFNLGKFQDNLYDGHPAEFMQRLDTLFKGMPYELQNEDNYRSIVWLLCTLTGTDPLAERHTHKGRSDLEVKVRDYIYVFEFKYEESVETAVAQLHDRDYAGQYALDSRKVFLIGANFSSAKEHRGLTGWEIEELKK